MRAGARQANGPGSAAKAAGGYLRKIGGGIGGGLENLRDLVTGYNAQGFMVSASKAPQKSWRVPLTDWCAERGRCTQTTLGLVFSTLGRSFILVWAPVCALLSSEAPQNSSFEAPRPLLEVGMAGIQKL